MADQILMPKATAVWLVDNSSLTFEQIADFCGLHHLEVKGIADGEVARDIRGADPIANGQLSREELDAAQKNADYRMKAQKSRHAELLKPVLDDAAGTNSRLKLLWIAIGKDDFLRVKNEAFIAALNEYLFALTFTQDYTARTVPVAIASIGGRSEHELPWANLMAASIIVTIPLIILVLIFQRRIIAGLTAGAVKG